MDLRTACRQGKVLVCGGAQSHDAYRVEEVLPYTQQYGVDDAQVGGLLCLTTFSALGSSTASHVEAQSEA